MRYVALPSNFKRKVSGSITKALECSAHYSIREIFVDWYDRKFYVLKDGIYFNPLRYKPEDFVVAIDYMVDKELLEDLKCIMFERYDRKLKSHQLRINSLDMLPICITKCMEKKNFMMIGTILCLK